MLCLTQDEFLQICNIEITDDKIVRALESRLEVYFDSNELIWKKGQDRMVSEVCLTDTLTIKKLMAKHGLKTINMDVKDIE